MTAEPRGFSVQSGICGTAPGGTWSTLPVENNGKWERALEIHSVNLVRTPLREESVASHRRVKATSLLFPGCFLVCHYEG